MTLKPCPCGEFTPGKVEYEIVEKTGRVLLVTCPCDKFAVAGTRHRGERRTAAIKRIWSRAPWLENAAPRGEK